ncbi:hypothetical protein B0A52_08488 [Exophiala mesophila]|uniref:G-patch domain-containing protein n=1 Tax=Exophiala mesophila TaxID=212818 RepID=A0A438MVU6_EXOME|nr:hypothetical protein B0A52_08488 [Exophiala mesophila]
MPNDSSLPPAPPPRGGLSLYANLLGPKSDAPGTISSAPVSYGKLNESSPEQDEAVKKQQALAASLRFQPTRRPQLSAQKAKAKSIASKFAPPAAAAVPAATVATEPTQDAPPETQTPSMALKTTLADWIATASDDDDVNNFYASGPKRERGGRKKRKKKKQEVEVIQNWDDIYDPSRPTNYEEFKRSEEKIREIREWKDLLYRHKMKRRGSSESDSDSYRPMNKQFAPPMSFAPPPNLNNESPPPPPPAPAVDILNDHTGEDAFLRRMRLSGMQVDSLSLPQREDEPDNQTSNNTFTPRSLAPPTGQISRAPVRYSLPDAPVEIPTTESELAQKLAESNQAEDESEDAPRSNRPGQAGFAERLMSKYGWTKGQGLGAQGTGIINPLYAKADKRKKKSDAEGGGFATPTAMGKILGGNKSKSAEAEEEGKFGAMSEVVRLDGMLQGLDLDEELGREEGGIMQEIGEECGDKYGKVERVYLHRPDQPEDQALVFVAFVSQLSALRAVNALEGRIFNGNTITARFWPKEKFDAGQYL